MRYFLDAEFNGFGGELISIALVPDDDVLPAFYETIICERPTIWVQEHVQPFLEKQPLDREQVSDRFFKYLHNDECPVIVADWPEDIANAARLLILGPGRMRPIRRIRFELTRRLSAPMSPRSSVTMHCGMLKRSALRYWPTRNVCIGPASIAFPIIRRLTRAWAPLLNKPLFEERWHGEMVRWLAAEPQNFSVRTSCKNSKLSTQCGSCEKSYHSHQSCQPSPGQQHNDARRPATSGLRSRQGYIALGTEHVGV
jgi:hypothetical protein